MLRSLRPALPATALFLASLVLSCAAPRGATTVALEAPIPSPPAHAPISERIRYWEDRMSQLGRADQSEARLCLGELYLESDQASKARLNFYAARNGTLSKREHAQAAYGVGRSHLLDGHPSLAVRHLDEASQSLQGPEGEECRFLAAFASGKSATSSDRALIARMAPYTGNRVFVASATAHNDFDGLYQMRRADWGAKPLLGNHDVMTRPYRITVHHTAEPAETYTLAESKREMRDLQRMHQEGKGWADIGYHFLIDQAGRVIEGRSLSVQGAHAGNSSLNRGNLGICLLGNFVAQPDRGSDYALAQLPTSEQMSALNKLVRQMQSRYQIADSEIWAHMDLKQTACPGPALKRWVRNKSGNP
jgi:N-acetylmuramoyl-L-alanine amidase